MTVTAFKEPERDWSWPPLCVDCRFCHENVLLRDGRRKEICTNPRFSPERKPVRLLAWNARYEHGCGFNGDFFEPRATAPAGRAPSPSRSA